jgi:Tol biopolymer transport system component
VITLRQLLSHTSGLSNGPVGARGQRWTPAEVIASMEPAACAPGTCFRYADMNFVVAGAVLEAAAGRPVARLARSRFFTPLGMADTWFQGAERARGRTATAYRDGVADSDAGPFVPTTDFVTRTGFSGSLASTSGDLVTWGDALFRGDVLQRRSLSEMLDVEATAELPCPLVQQCASGYGLGMEQSHLNAWTVWQHAGSTGALLTHFRRQGVTIAVVTNSAPGASSGQFFVTRALVDALPALRGSGAVFAIDADGSNRRRVTPRGLRAGVPAVSPDGERLAFVTEARGARDRSDIAIADVDGHNDRLLTHDHANNFHPAWSPDGRQIAFASSRDGNPEIYVARLDGSDPRRLTDDPGQDSGPAWSPDGTHIAFSRHVDDQLHLVVIGADGSDPRTVVSMTVHGPYTGEPSWSPDGNRLAFTGDVGGVPNIQVVDLDGTNLTAVTSGHAPSTEVAWAADGTLAFGRLGVIHTVVPGSDAPPRRLEGRADRVDFLPAWSPDSRAIYFTANAG